MQSEKTLDCVGDEVGTITGGAFETTAHTIRYILYYLYSDPAMLRKLRSELVTVDGGVSSHCFTLTA